MNEQGDNKDAATIQEVANDNAKKNTFDNYTDDELNKAKKFAFLPTGIFGVHDFMIGRMVQGIAHIILSVFCFIFCNGFGEMICKSMGNCKTASDVDTFYRTIFILGVIFLIGSWVWAAFEGEEISEIILERHKTPQQKIAEKEEGKIQRKRDVITIKKVFAALSIIAGAIMIIGDLLVLVAWLLVKSCSGSQCSGSLMMSAMLVGGYTYIVAPLLSVLGIVFGTIGIGKKENGKFRWLAVFGLVLGILGGVFAILLIKNILS